MKLRILLSLFILQVGELFAQPIILWDTEVIVADGSMYGNTRPRIALSSGDTPVVIWGKGVTGELFTARWNGAGFDLPVAILPPNVQSYLSSWTGPDLEAKGDVMVAVFKAMPLEGGHVLTVRSTDGGISWSDTIRADSHNNGGVVWLPSMAMDENANPSVIYMAHDPVWATPRYVVSHSLDQGLTFQNEMNIAASIPDEACDCCPAEYVIDGNQHALLFRNNAANIRDVYAVYSDDDGLSYTGTENIDQLNWNVTSCPSTGPDGVFNNGNLFSVYASRASGSYRVYLSQTSTNPLLSFSSRVMMSAPTNTNGVQNYPRIDASNDTIAMIWQESETSNYEIFTALTTTGNLNELVNSKALVNTSTNGAQTNPDILFSNRTVHVVYQDSPTGSVIYKRGTLSAVGLDPGNKNNFEVHPNPSSSGTFVLENIGSSFEIHDVNGKKVTYDCQEVADKMLIRLDAKGVYYLHLVKDSFSQMIRLVYL